MFPIYLLSSKAFLGVDFFFGKGFGFCRFFFYLGQILTRGGRPEVAFDFASHFETHLIYLLNCSVHPKQVRPVQQQNLASKLNIIIIKYYLLEVHLECIWSEQN